MRQVKRIPKDRAYDFGIGVTDQFGLRKKAGDFVTEENVKKFEIPEKYLEPKGKEKYLKVKRTKKFLQVKGTEKYEWDDEVPENANIIIFEIKTEILGGDREERKRMVDQFEREFKGYIRERGTVIFKVVNTQIIKKRKKKSKR